ncbi:MAG: hypothetical protein OXC40_06365, partial [Proteobacteria bacterium]|nr:hypothetical protein [Pseudomonadota bacterium]
VLSYVQKKMQSSYRRLSQYQSKAEFIELSRGEKGILMFSYFTHQGQEMSQIHVAIPRAKYYFLISYTDLKSLVSHSSDPSFELFWNIIQKISLPPTSRLSALVFDKSAGVFFLFAIILFFIMMAASLIAIKKRNLISENINEVNDMMEFNEQKLASQQYKYERRKVKRKKPTRKPAKKSKMKKNPLWTPEFMKDDEEEYTNFKGLSATKSLSDDLEGLDATMMDHLDVPANNQDEGNHKSSHKDAS